MGLSKRLQPTFYLLAWSHSDCRGSCWLSRCQTGRKWRRSLEGFASLVARSGPRRADPWAQSSLATLRSNCLRLLRCPGCERAFGFPLFSSARHRSSSRRRRSYAPRSAAPRSTQYSKSPLRSSSQQSFQKRRGSLSECLSADLPLFRLFRSEPVRTRAGLGCSLLN